MCSHTLSVSAFCLGGIFTLSHFNLQSKDRWLFYLAAMGSSFSHVLLGSSSMANCQPKLKCAWVSALPAHTHLHRGHNRQLGKGEGKLTSWILQSKIDQTLLPELTLLCAFLAWTGYLWCKKAVLSWTQQNHCAFVFWICCYHPATPLLFLREKWLIASVCYSSLEKQGSNITASWTVSLNSLVTGTIPNIIGIFVGGLHCTVPPHLIWTLQTNTMRKGNTKHSPSPTLSSCPVLPFTPHRLPAPSGRKGFYFALLGGTQGRWGGWSIGRAGFASRVSHQLPCLHQVHCKSRPVPVPFH